MSTPGVRLPAPMLFLASLLLAHALHRSGFAIHLSGDATMEIVLRVLGQVVVGGALLVMGWAMLTFRRAQTAIMPHKAASRLVTSGPYRHSRNPMYVCLVAMQLGLCLIYNTPWPALLLPLVILLLQRRIILREERHLIDTFGQDYLDYCARVGRWLRPWPRGDQRPLAN
ncbi:MAG: isoprenylcysteine carboxylmethyltransferase family protein [Pseudoxanthomonas suwonensis]|nr:isoprenylcysteine carboxylmethyltransferase family protein [Pseudoxanthomonas suwonensis]